MGFSGEKTGNELMKFFRPEDFLAGFCPVFQHAALVTWHGIGAKPGNHIFWPFGGPWITNPGPLEAELPHTLTIPETVRESGIGHLYDDRLLLFPGKSNTFLSV
jgi:hypothetical protein